MWTKVRISIKQSQESLLFLIGGQKTATLNIFRAFFTNLFDYIRHTFQIFSRNSPRQTKANKRHKAIIYIK